jgi:hypothetical protein
MLNDLYEIAQAQGNPDQKLEKRGSTLLILDRSFDLIAPVAHDFYY